MTIEIHSLDQAISKKINNFGMNLHSRIHTLRSCNGQIDIKRDDELSFGISGNKLRKIASMLPMWKQNQPVIAIGSSTSNHIVASLQLFNEHAIDYELWLKESHVKEEAGNQAYIKLLSLPGRIKTIATSDWPKVELLAKEYISSKGCGYLMVEGGCQNDAIWGAMTLGQEILGHSQSYEHIFIDAGTGLSAVGLHLYLDAAKWPGILHIVAMAPIDYQDLYTEMKGYTNVASSISSRVHEPITAKSFGSINRACADEVVRMAREDGVILDPLYGSKLALTVKKLVHEYPGQKALMIHSGGGLSLGGFWSKLRASF